MADLVEIAVPSEMWPGGGAAEGVVVNWFKREGSPLNAGEIVAEVMIEKVTLEIPAPVRGRLAKILVPQGEVVKPGQPLGEVLPADEMQQPAPGEASPPPARRAAEEPFVPASPAARRLAKELGVDLHLVKPTGSGGRITEEDVRRFKARGGQAPEYEMIPLAGIRKITAQRMVESLARSAQLTLFHEADVTELARLKSERSEIADVSYTDLLARAVVLTLPRHRRLNAHLVDGSIHQYRPIHLGIAVALSDGLIVPVVKNADRLSLAELSAEIKRLAEAARAGTLTPAGASGSSFSLSNLGMYATDFFTPILNPPEVAILGIGRITDRLVPTAGGPEPRRLISLSLTIDHQVVDGAAGADFLRDLAALLAEPAALYA